MSQLTKQVIQPTEAASRLGQENTSVAVRPPSQRGGVLGFLTRVASSYLFGYIFSLAMLVVAWQLVIVFFDVDSFIMPAPIDVAERMVKNAKPLLDNTLITLREILIGFGLSAVFGILIGTAIAFSRILERIIYPLLVSTQAMPKVALAPIFVMWLGFGARTNALVAVLTAIFPIIINTTLGLRSIDPDLIRLGQMMGGSRLRIFLKIRIPTALPSIFAGLKLGITFATIGAVVGEFVGATEGLGYLAQMAAGTLDSELAFSSIVILAVLGVVLFLVVELFERFIVRWHVSQT